MIFEKIRAENAPTITVIVLLCFTDDPSLRVSTMPSRLSDIQKAIDFLKDLLHSSATSATTAVHIQGAIEALEKDRDKLSKAKTASLSG